MLSLGMVTPVGKWLIVGFVVIRHKHMTDGGWGVWGLAVIMHAHRTQEKKETLCRAHGVPTRLRLQRTPSVRTRQHQGLAVQAVGLALGDGAAAGVERPCMCGGVCLIGPSIG